jgi:hypothetical protein
METLKVYWLGKFNGRQVTINAVDFDPAIHSLEPVKKAPVVEPEIDAAVIVEPEPVKPKAKGKK